MFLSVPQNIMQKSNNLQLDGTSSTNYGPLYEIYGAMLLTARSSQIYENFTIWINNDELTPWDDLVINLEEKWLMLVQLKHTVAIKKKGQEKMNSIEQDLAKIEKVLIAVQKSYPNIPKENIIYVYYAIASVSDKQLPKFSKMTSDIPDQLKLILTDTSNLYRKTDGSNVYICLNQHNASELIFEDTKAAFRGYIGNEIQMEGSTFKWILNDCYVFFRDWYNRFLQGKNPLTKQQIGKKIAQIILERLKASLKETDMQAKHLPALDKVLKQEKLVVLNHKRDSNAAMHILLHYIKKFNLDQEDDNTALMDELMKKWLDNKLHLPVVSKNQNMDRLILRALQLSNFQLNVIILRHKKFTITRDQTVYTILQNLDKSGEFSFNAGENTETFAYARVSLDKFKNDIEKIHHDNFSKAMLEYFSSRGGVFPTELTEAHDEKNYVNEFNEFGEERKEMPAICACLKLQDIKIDALKCVISVGANVNSNALGDSPPLLLACYANREDIVSLLLENGAAKDNADYSGTFALFAALEKGAYNIFKMLLDQGAKLDVTDGLGNKLLHRAYLDKKFDFLELFLLDNKSPFSAADKDGNTFLHLAARDGDTECLKLVLKYQDNLQDLFKRTDVNGHSAKEIAKNNKFFEFSETMEEAGLP